VGPRNHALDGVQIPQWAWAILRGKGWPIVKYRDILRSSVQITAEPIKMPFGLWALMGPRNHVLDGGTAVLRDVAMATNFGTQFAVTGFVHYKFGCMTASNKLFNLRVGFRKLSNEDIAEIECLRVVAMATNFRTNTAINWLCVNDSD